MVADLARLGGVGEDRAAELLECYGTCAHYEVLGGRGETPLASLPSHAREEFAWMVRTERARIPDDQLRRRTAVAISGLASEAVRAEVAGLLAEMAPAALAAAG